MTPDARHHNPDPVYLRELMRRTGLSQREVAARLGMGARMLRYYLAEEGKHRAPYAVQYCLEVLAAAREPARDE